MDSFIAAKGVDFHNNMKIIHKTPSRVTNLHLVLSKVSNKLVLLEHGDTQRNPLGDGRRVKTTDLYTTSPVINSLLESKEKRRGENRN